MNPLTVGPRVLQATAMPCEESNRISTRRIATQPTGSSFLIIAGEWVSGTINSYDDRYGNAYTTLALDNGGVNPFMWAAYCFNGVGGPEHYFNAAGDGPHVMALEMSGVSTYVGQTTTRTSARPYTSGTLAVQKGDLLIGIYGGTDSSGKSVHTTDVSCLNMPTVLKIRGENNRWNAYAIGWAVAQKDGDASAIFDVGTPALPSSKATIMAFRP